MKASLVLLLTPIAAALPATFIQLDSELAARRENVTERMATLDERQASVSIDQLFKNKGKVYIGSATDRGLLQTGKNAAILQANFGQVTPENSMKWDALQPSQGQFNWDNADYLVNWAQQNGKSIRGHTLVWHSQLPQWVKNINNADTLRQVIRTHVKAAVGRYSGKIRAWVRDPYSLARCLMTHCSTRTSSMKSSTRMAL